MSWEAAAAYIESNAERFEAELCDWLRIPSISADSRYAGDVRKAGEWIRDRLAAAGLTTELHETPGHPIVLAEFKVDPAKPTVLIYGHYDVQPVDPLDEWITPPFEPALRNGNVVARGATDDKGQVFTHVLAVRSWLASGGTLPVNVTFLIEGEEEVGSEHLEAFVAAHRDRLKCDVIVISDTSQFGPGRPAITYGLRGISYHEVRQTGPKQDLHSGTFGGGVTNPAVALCRMLADAL